MSAAPFLSHARMPPVLPLLLPSLPMMEFSFSRALSTPTSTVGATRWRPRAAGKCSVSHNLDQSAGNQEVSNKISTKARLENMPCEP
jgi:hypothetical protein